MNFSQYQLDFIEKAMDSIHDDPYTRASPLVKSVLANNNYVFDVHCHVFDGKCINVKYLAARLIAGAAGRFKSWVLRLVTGRRHEFNKSLLTTEQIVDMIYEDPLIVPDSDLPSALERMEKELDLMEAEAKEMKSLYRFDLIEFLKRYRSIIRLLSTGNMESVYKIFEKNYAIHQVLNSRSHENLDLLAITLGMDLNSGWEGKIPKSYEDQNSELALLSKKYPILPYLPIDPRREDLHEVFLKAFDKEDPQFFGVKCYPALGYLPSDERLMPIFKICEAKNIPVLTHCGGEVVSTFEKRIRANRLGVEVEIKDRTRKDRARKLNEPCEWDFVLNEFKKLRLCLAHFGGTSAWENDTETAHRIPEILDMMYKYENLYSDFSFNLESQTAIQNFRNKMIIDDVYGNLMKTRTLYGTDFWVILPVSNLIEDQNNFVEETAELVNDLLKNNVLEYLKLN